MFKPNAKIKKLLRSSNTCAYIHRDGIVICEEKEVGNGKYKARIDVYHIIPCEIEINQYDYSKEYSSQCREVDRIVVHNAKMLIGGLESVSVAFCNNSEKSKEMGINATTITITGNDGLEFRVDSLPFLSCGLTIQPNQYDSYTTYTAPNSIEKYEREEYVEYYE